MRIVIDATSLLLASSGVKTYLYYWVQALLRSATRDSIVLFPFFGRPSDLDHRRSCVGRVRTAVGIRGVQFSNIKWNPVLEIIGATADVFHASQHLWNPPSLCTRLTATIYDMTCWKMPEVHTPSNIVAGRRYGERVLRRAIACIAISESSKNDAVEILKLPTDSVDVIYPGVADKFFNVGHSEARAAAKKYQLDRPYFLYVGTIEPRKNVDRLLNAYQSLHAAAAREHDLVIVGPMGWRSDTTESRLRNPRPGIRYLGYVTEADLPGVTAGATAFVFPALYEGFGLPPMQAMACGVPVIASRNSALDEVLAGATLAVDPVDTDEIAAAMSRAADSPSLREDLGQRGRLRAARFRWEHNAERSLAFFRKVASLGRA